MQDVLPRHPNHKQKGFHVDTFLSPLRAEPKPIHRRGKRGSQKKKNASRGDPGVKPPYERFTIHTHTHASRLFVLTRRTMPSAGEQYSSPLPSRMLYTIYTLHGNPTMAQHHRVYNPKKYIATTLQQTRRAKTQSTAIAIDFCSSRSPIITPNHRASHASPAPYESSVPTPTRLQPHSWSLSRRRPLLLLANSHFSCSCWRYCCRCRHRSRVSFRCETSRWTTTRKTQH